MIFGIGEDIVDIRRVEKVYNRFGDRFLARCFTDIEQKKARSRVQGGTHINTLAKRFAAKEALTKALGTGFSNGVFHKDIGVVNNQFGKPDIILTGGAKVYLEKQIPSGKEAAIHLTITDEPPLAKATVIIELL